MKSAAPFSDSVSQSQQVIAYFHAQDTQVIKELRDLFASMGTAVIVNTPIRELVTYCICAGDVEFVKSIDTTVANNSRKVLFIVYGTIPDTLNTMFPESSKIYVVDAKPLSKTQAQEIARFFFTSASNYNDDRKDRRHTMITPNPLPEAAREDKVNLEYRQELEQRISNTIKQLYEQPPKKRKTKQSSVYKKILLILLAISMPLVIYTLVLLVGVFSLIVSIHTLRSGAPETAKRLAQVGKSNFSINNAMILVVSPFTPNFLNSYINNQQITLSILQHSSDLLVRSSAIAKEGRKFVQNTISLVPKNNRQSSIATLMQLRSEISFVRTDIALAQADIQQLQSQARFPFTIPIVFSYLEKTQQQLDYAHDFVTFVDNLFTLIPHISGYREEQTFLVLFQNSMELRPTGGFIGSLAKATLSDGMVNEFTVLDVYTVDGQLKGHVDPPIAIRQLLPSEHWYLRDSNWDPNFPLSAERAAWFFEKETGTKVDGVVAFSLPVITKLLSILGPIELTDFNERITSDNLFAKSLLYTQTDFFAGSTQKKDFLGSLAHALLLELSENRSIPLEKFFLLIADSFVSRDIQLFSTDHDIQAQLGLWRWDGDVPMFACRQSYIDSSHCAPDGRMINAANVGVNKVNYFVSAHVDETITIEQNNTVTSQLRYNITNASTGNVADGGGNYRSYVRFYYPLGTELISVQWKGTTIPIIASDSDLVDMSSTVQIVNESNAVSFGLLVTVPPKGNDEVIITTKRIMPDAQIYAYTIQKQAGVPMLPWHVQVRNLAKGSELEYNTDLDFDFYYEVPIK